MSHFILPITIDSRKVVFLELKRSNTLIHFPDKVEDVFIVRLPQGVINQSTLITIKRSGMLQALSLNQKDLSLGSLKVSVEEVDAGIINIYLSNSVEGDLNIELQSGNNLIVEDSSEKFDIKYINNTSGNDIEEIKMRFILNFGDKKHISNAVFHMVPREKIRLLALDFGSEACQMKEGIYGTGAGVNIQLSAVDIFKLLRKSEGGNIGVADKYYEQFESSRLYKSIFYASKTIEGERADRHIFGNKLYWLNKGITMTIPSNLVNSVNAKFFHDNAQIPNLKLVRNDKTISDSLSFNLMQNKQSIELNFSELRGSLYMALLKRILKAYFDEKIGESVFLRFTLLVPNIYSIEDIAESKKIIAEIFDEYIRNKPLKVLGFEIDCLSESDASFLGCQNKINLNPNEYFIVIDCGKGTTDFSLLELEGNSNIFRSIYKNGFAGAGNYITYAFIKSACYFLKNEFSDNPSHKKKIDEFFNEVFSEKGDIYFHTSLFRIAERWKKNYNESIRLSKVQVEEQWRNATTGFLTIEKMIDQNELYVDSFISLLNKIEYSWDWNGYVGDAISNIVESIVTQLSPVVLHQNQHSRCGGILITGRGAYFQPLSDAIIGGIQGIKGMKNANKICLDGIDLKEVCLEGVFNPIIRFYADLYSTPVEVEKDTLKTTIKKRTFLEKLWKKNAIGSAYDSESNTIEIINIDNLINCRFIIGGNIYMPADTSSSMNSLFLIPTRDGVYIVEKDAEQKITKINHLIRDINSSLDNGVKVIESLYPSWWKKQGNY